MEPRTAVRLGTAVWTAASLLRLIRAILLAPVFSAASLASGLFWLVVPGFVARALWRRSEQPGTLLHRLRTRAELGAARAARRHLL